MAKYVKIRREGFPANTVCKVVSTKGNDSSVKLPDGSIVKLYTAFLYEDRDTRAATIAENSKIGIKK